MKSINWNIISKKRLDLFGFATISILIFHYCEDVVNQENAGVMVYSFAQLYNFLIGSIGVEIFLFLSGVGLWFSLKNKSDVRHFLGKRIERLLIPYCIWGALFWWIKDIVIEQTGITQFFKDYALISFWTEGNRTVWYIGIITILSVFFPLLYRAFDSSEEKRRRRF